MRSRIQDHGGCDQIRHEINAASGAGAIRQKAISFSRTAGLVRYADTETMKLLVCARRPLSQSTVRSAEVHGMCSAYAVLMLVALHVSSIGAALVAAFGMGFCVHEAASLRARQI